MATSEEGFLHSAASRLLVTNSLGFIDGWDEDKLATGRMVSFLAMVIFVLPLSVTVYDHGLAHYLKHYSNYGLISTLACTGLLSWASVTKNTSYDSLISDLLITSASMSLMGLLVEWTLQNHDVSAMRQQGYLESNTYEQIITDQIYYGSLKILVPFIPVCIDFFELFVDKITFTYDRAWRSAFVGGIYAFSVIIVRLVIELFSLEDDATIQSPDSIGSFIYFM